MILLSEYFYHFIYRQIVALSVVPWSVICIPSLCKASFSTICGSNSLTVLASLQPILGNHNSKRNIFKSQATQRPVIVLKCSFQELTQSAQVLSPELRDALGARDSTGAESPLCTIVCPRGTSRVMSQSLPPLYVKVQLATVELTE